MRRRRAPTRFASDPTLLLDAIAVATGVRLTPIRWLGVLVVPLREVLAAFGVERDWLSARLRHDPCAQPPAAFIELRGTAFAEFAAAHPTRVTPTDQRQRRIGQLTDGGITRLFWWIETPQLLDVFGVLLRWQRDEARRMPCGHLRVVPPA